MIYFFTFVSYMENNTNKIGYLEGIRGLAALLVFFHHFGLAFYSAYFTHNIDASHLNGAEVRYGQSVFSVFSNGNFCVYVFFVLSGFVLSRKYFQTNAFSTLVSGAQRRFIRLYIPIAATIILSFILMQAGLYYNGPASTITHSEWWLGSMWTFPDAGSRLFSSLFYTVMFQGDSAFDTTLSSMSIEFYGSLFVFAFLALTHSTCNKHIMLLFVLLYCLFTRNIYTATFALGISLNYLEQRHATLNRATAGVFAVILALIGLVLGSFPTNGMIGGTVYENMSMAVLQQSGWFHIIGAFFVVSAFVLSPILQRIISLRLFIFLGYISFSLYLIHPLVIGSFSSYLFLKLSETMPYNNAVALVFLLSLALCIPLSWAMTKFVDVPGTKFAKTVYERFAKAIPETATGKTK
ncbi:MAG: acyltransferase 3 [Flavipsychrobacter sp.]|nr:acyltransferase 3 [Flavipsychrobacter sp.]